MERRDKIEDRRERIDCLFSPLEISRAKSISHQEQKDDLRAGRDGGVERSDCYFSPAKLFTSKNVSAESMNQPRGLGRLRGLHQEQEDHGRARRDGGVERSDRKK